MSAASSKTAGGCHRGIATAKIGEPFLFTYRSFLARGCPYWFDLASRRSGGLRDRCRTRCEQCSITSAFPSPVFTCGRPACCSVRITCARGGLAVLRDPANVRHSTGFDECVSTLKRGWDLAAIANQVPSVTGGAPARGGRVPRRPQEVQDLGTAFKIASSAERSRLEMGAIAGSCSPGGSLAAPG